MPSFCFAKMVEKDAIIWYDNIGIVYSPQIKCFWRTKMYTAIKNYCNNGNNNGLFLLDMPTGERVIIVMGALNALESKVSGTLNRYISRIT